MSKTIKVIDLLNKIANGEEVPKKINLIGKKFDEYFEYDLDEKKYLNKADESLGESWILDEILDNEVKIIEEEPEIDIQSYKELLLEPLTERKYNNSDIYMLGTQINALIGAVKKLDNQINNK